jgi:hypothetical protein
MAQDMSRRGLFSLLGGLLAAFGLVPHAKARPPVPTPPPVTPAVPSLDYASYLGGTGYPCSTTLVYDPTRGLAPPILPGTVTTYTYSYPRSDK